MQLSKQNYLFQVSGAIGADGIARIELPDPHWLLWGQKGNLFTIAGDVAPDRKADFKALVEFSKERRTEFDANLSMTLETVSATGDSNYALSDPEAVGLMSNGQREIRFTPILNSQKRLAGMESEIVADTTFDDAIDCALNFSSRLERILGVMTRIPLFVATIQVASIDTLQSYTRSIYPYPVAHVSKFATPKISCMSPFLSVYAEGMREPSPFYRFLCFFKLVDKLLAGVNPTLQVLAREQATVSPDMNLTMPSDPFAVILPSVVGRRYTWVRDSLQSKFRNVIAHFDPASPVEPFNLASEFEVSKSAMALAYISYDLLSRSYDFLLELKRRSHDLDAVRF
jgi:hypothetical protein